MAAHSPARSAASASKFGELIPMLARHDAMVLLDISPECEREAEKRARAGESVPVSKARRKSSQGKNPVSLAVIYFTVPRRAHPSTGSQSGSATPGQTQVPSTRSRGLLNCRK